MDLILYFVYFLIVFIIITADTQKKILSHPVVSYIILLLSSNAFLLLTSIDKVLSGSGLSFGIIGFIVFSILFLYSWIRIQAVPCKTESEVPMRVRIVYQGRQLLLLSVGLATTQLLIILSYALLDREIPINADYFRYNTILAFCLILLTFLNGWFRILFFSSRLQIIRRILVCIYIWIPVVNLFVLFYMSRVAYNEYDHACNKAYNENMRKDSFVCKTRYPLLMLHGVGFRDLKYINYWGRIPKNLIRNGATIYYGHQEALGTIESNGQMVKDKIFEIIKQTGMQKVNIIAHSKGGLDARYTITTLDMEEYVASLTTISTPHRGSALADFANKYISDKMFRSIGNIFDKYFLKIGDKTPDFYTAMHQFTEEYAKKFNKETPDSESVYYQSYMSLMKNCLSHSLLSIPYSIMCIKDKKNDGLVSLESAQWGNFRGVFTNKGRRGVSHGDMIDITRGNYKNFDVIDTYIDIVADLKDRGF